MAHEVEGRQRSCQHQRWLPQGVQRAGAQADPARVSGGEGQAEQGVQVVLVDPRHHAVDSRVRDARYDRASRRSPVHRESNPNSSAVRLILMMPSGRASGPKVGRARPSRMSIPWWRKGVRGAQLAADRRSLPAVPAQRTRGRRQRGPRADRSSARSRSVPPSTGGPPSAPTMLRGQSPVFREGVGLDGEVSSKPGQMSRPRRDSCGQDRHPAHSRSDVAGLEPSTCKSGPARSRAVPGWVSV